MANKVKRPISVWIAQILFVLYALLVVLAFFLAIMTTQPSNRSFPGVLFTAIANVIFVALSTTAFWGMAARKPYGRWLGVGLLSFMVIFANLSKVLFPSDSDQSMTGIVIQVLFSVLLGIVILHISLSDKMEAFFIGKVDSSRLDHPPPPPSFD